MKKFIIILMTVCLISVKSSLAETTSYIPENPQSAMIIIHGYGGNGYGMKWMTNSLKEHLPNMAFYYPTAPDKAPNGGYQWFVIPVLGEEIKEKALYDTMMADALKNVSKLHELIDEIHKTLHISYQNIYVSGFSQGGLMALLTTLTNPHQLPAAVSFSGVPLLITPDFSAKIVKNKPDILLIKGDRDKVIPQDSLEMTTQTLNELKIEPKIRLIKGMSHQINQQALQNAIEFIK